MPPADQLLEVPRHIRNVVDSVVDIIHLPAAGEFSLDGLPHHLVIVFHHISLDRHTVLWSLLQHAHIPDPDQAHMQGSRDRSGSQCQDVDIFSQFFDLLLMRYSEPLLLVNDQQPQVLEAHVLSRGQAVGADHDIRQTLFQILHCLFLLIG